MSTLISFYKLGYPGALPGVDAGVDAVGMQLGKTFSVLLLVCLQR